ncbi:MAG: methyl-accepting chemotaxis protein [bacterium]|nr:methyl-accepting chemotaxis protein [bacterium]
MVIDDIPIRTKLLGVSIAIAVTSLVIGWFFDSTIEEIVKTNDRHISYFTPVQNTLHEMKGSLNLAVSAEFGLAVYDFRTRGLTDDLYVSNANALKTIATAKQFLDSLLKDNPTYQTEWSELTGLLSEWEKINKEAIETSKQIDRKLGSNDKSTNQSVVELNTKLIDAAVRSRLICSQISPPLLALLSAIREEATKAQEDERAKSSRIYYIIIAITLISLVFTVAVGIFFGSNIARPLDRMVDMMQELEKGHLGNRVHVPGKDEIGLIGSSIDNFAERLDNVVSALQKVSNGDLSTKISPADDKDIVANSYNGVVENLVKIKQELDTLVFQAHQGNLKARGNDRAFDGAYKEIIVGFNQVLETFSQPIEETLSTLERIADKDLTVRIVRDLKGDYNRLKNAVNETANNLEQGMSAVADSADRISEAAHEISRSSQALAQGASEQAASLEEVSATVEEISAMTEQTASNSAASVRTSEGAVRNADKGNIAMEKMTAEIGRIKDSADRTSKIIKTIDEIAFQTNLLALNAAVEAARAGEAGKGFAVVAEEVRNLAQRSAAAAKSTTELIDESRKNADSGVVITREVADHFQQIQLDLKAINTSLDSISTAAVQQSEGLKQVNIALSQLSSVTQQNAASSEEAASASESLNSQSTEMSNLVSEFVLNERRASAQKRIGTGAKPMEALPNRSERRPLKALPERRSGRADEVIPLDMDDLSEF